MSKTTVTKSNEMSPDELDRFLWGKNVACLGTVRADGSAHVTPMWYIWDEGKIKIILGTTRLHTKNIRRDPRATVCIDEDPRPRNAFALGAQGAVCRGRVELTQDPAVLQTNYRRFERSLEFEHDADYHAARESEERVLALITPEHWLSWDFTKA